MSETSERPRRRWLKWLGVAVAFMLALIVLAIVALPWLSNQFARPYIARAAQEQLHAPVSIERLSVSWFGGVRLENLRVGPADAQLASLRGFKADVKLLPLLKGDIVFIGDVVVDTPTATVVIADDGTSNWRPAAETPKDESPASNGPMRLPNVIGTLVVKDFGLTIVAEGKTASLPPISATLRLDTFDKPISLDIASSDRTLTLSANARIAHAGIVDPGRVTAKIDYHIAPEFTSPLAPLASVIDPNVDWDGALGGDGSLSINDDRAVQGDGKLTADTKRLAIRRGDQPTWNLDPGRVQLTFAANCDQAGAFTADVSVSAPGAELRVDAKGTAVAGRQQATTSLTTVLDLAELSRRLPGVIGDPSQGLPIPKIQSTITGDFTHAHDALNAVARIELNGGDTVHVAADVAADTGAGRYSVSNASVAFPGIAIAGKGQAELAPGARSPIAALGGITSLGSDITAHIDIAAALAGLRQLVPALPASWNGAGIVDATLSAGSTNANAIALKAQVNAQSIRIDGLSGATLPATARVDLDAELDLEKDQATLSTATIITDLGSIDASHTAVEAALTDAPTAKPQVKATFTSAQLATFMPGYDVAGNDLACAFTGSVNKDGGDILVKLSAPGLSITPANGKRFDITAALSASIASKDAWKNAEVALSDGAFSGRQADAPALAASLTAVMHIPLADPKGAVTIENFALQSDLATISGNASATRSAAGFEALDVQWQGTSDLAKVLALAADLKLMPPDARISGGTLDWTLAAHAKQEEIPFAFTLAMPDFAYQDAKITLPKQKLNVTLKGTATGRGDTLTLDAGSGVAMTTLQAAFSGGVTHLLTKPIADKLAVTLSYAPPDINPVLSALGAGQLVGDKPQQSQLMLSGPLIPGELLPWLATLDTHESALGFGTFSEAGFVVAGQPVPLRLKNGALALDYECSINKGPARLIVDASIPMEKARTSITMKNIGITNDLAWLLAYFNPIFRLGKDGTLNGEASFQCDGNWHGPFLPADMRKALGTSLDAKGSFSADQVVIKGSPVLEGILKGIGNASKEGLADVSPTDFTVRKGVFDYKKMVVRVGDLDLIFAGTANIVTDALDMTLTMPFPRKAVDKATAKYLPKTLVVPITGTISEPEFEYDKAFERAMKDAAKEAAKEVVKDKAGDLLEGLLKKK